MWESDFWLGIPGRVSVSSGPRKVTRRQLRVEVFSKSVYIEIYMIGHAFQILDGDMEKDFDVAFSERLWKKMIEVMAGMMILRQFHELR